MADVATAPEVLPLLRRHKLNVVDFHKLGEAGVLDERSRVELFEGELIDMAPIGNWHAGVVDQLMELLVRHSADIAVRVQNPVVFGNESELQPDLAVLRRRADYYRGGAPTPQDVILQIEVPESTLAYDRGPKLELYARHAIPEVWIVNLPDRVVEVFREPGLEGYTFRDRRDLRQSVSTPALPGLVIEVSTLF